MKMAEEAKRKTKELAAKAKEKAYAAAEAAKKKFSIIATTACFVTKQRNIFK